MLTDNFSSAVQLHTEINAQSQLSHYRRVNEQARGELAGQKTGFDGDAQQIQTEIKAQQELNTFRRVNEQVRKEWGTAGRLSRVRVR